MQVSGGLLQGEMHLGWRIERQRLCAVLLAQLIAIGTNHQGRVQVAWCGQLQAALQPYLSRGVVCQVVAAHHMRDGLRGIVHHNGQLVSPQLVLTP